MGQLTNLYVSQSYQGLLKMTNSTTGVTGTLQTVQTGDGTNTPLQISQTEVNISGSLTVNGSPISVDTGSLVTTASFNAYTSSVNTHLAGLDVETGSLQNQINGLATTGSLSGYTTTTVFNNYTSSNDSRVNSLISQTGSYVTETESGSFLITGSVNNNTLTFTKGDGSQFNLTVATGSQNRDGLITTGSVGQTQSITGSVNVSGTITATSASFTYVTTTYETASVIYSSGSNQFGDASNDTQTLYGTVRLPNGPLSVTGSVIATNFTGSLQGTASFAQNAQNATTLANVSASFYARRNQANTFTADNTFQGDVTIQSGSQLIAYEINSDANERLLILSDGTPSGPGARIIFGDTPSGGSPGVLSDTTVSITGSLGVSAGITGSLQGNASSATNATNFSNRGIAQFALTGSNSFNGNQTITGSVTASAGFVGDLTGTASYATQALSASYAPDTTNTGSFMITGSVSGPTSTFTKGDGSTFNLTVDNVQSASFADNAGTASFVNSAVTSSIAFDLVVLGKCDNPGGLTKGTIVRITGANGDNPLFNSASWTDDANSANTLGMLTENVAYNGFANIVTQGTVIGINTNGMTAGDMLYLSSSGQYTTSSVPAPYHEVRLGQVLRPQLNNGSAYISIDNGYELTELHDVDITSPVDGDLLVYRSGSYGQWVNETGGELGFATTGSNNFIGTENITGSVNVSGSANFVGPVGLNLLQPNSFKQNLTLLGGVNHFTSSTVLNNYLNAITTSLSNNDNNFVLPPGGGLGANIANLTGSVFISGSNNIITNLGSGTPASAGRRQLVGSGNYIISAPTINTSSLTIPNFNNNYNAGQFSFTLTTGSNLGNSTHNVSSNVNLGAVLLNIPSASITTGNAGSSVNNNVNVGSVTLTTTGPTILTTAATLTNNIISNGNVALNHQSSSIQFSTNIVGGQGLTVNNSYYQTGSNNFLAASANIFAGQGITINASGAPATNVSRTLVGNIIGGQTVNVNLTQNNLDTAGLRNSLIYGQGLVVLGSHSAASTTQNSIAILGRWNGQDNGLDDSARTVFAVGTGTGTSNRRTSLYVTSGSLVGVSGSLDVKGVTNALVVTGSANITHGIAGQTALTVVNSVGVTQPGLSVSGTTTLVGNTTISGSNPLRVGTYNNEGIIQTLGGSQWLYRNTDTYNTVVGNSTGVQSGFAAGSEKNMIFNGFNTPFNNGSNNVIIQGAGDNFISGSNNVFIGGHNGQAGGSDNILIGATSYTSGSLFDSKFELSTIASSRIFHKDGSNPLQIGDDTQVTGSISISSVMNLKPQNPLPSGNIGDLAVSSSNQLYFYNGAWTLIV